MGGFLDMLLGSNDNVMGQAKEMFGGDIPNIGQITSILGSAPEAAVQQATRTAVGGLAPDVRGQFGGVLDAFLGSTPAVAQQFPNLNMAQIQQGNTDMIGDVVGGLIKNQGLGSLTSMFAAGEPPQKPDGILDNVLDMFGITGDDGQFGISDLLGLMNNPIAAPLIKQLLPALMKLA